MKKENTMNTTKNNSMMKHTVLTASIAAACLVSASALADFPPVIIDTNIVLDYQQTIDMTGAVSIPTAVNLPDEADISINQFNHDSPITATANLINNTPSGLDGQWITSVNVDVTAVGNNASIDVSNTSPVIGSVQGNQNSMRTAVGAITGNRFDLDAGEIVELNVTTVGNNLTIDAEDASNIYGVQVGSIQYNYDSGSIAIGSITDNGFGVNAPTTPTTTTPVMPPRGNDPILNVTAVGNNLSTIAPTSGSMTQINRGSTVVATGLIARNIGPLGPVSMNVSAVGNNISIKQPTINQ